MSKKSYFHWWWSHICRRRFTRYFLDGPIKRKPHNPERKSRCEHIVLHARHLRDHELQRYEFCKENYLAFRVFTGPLHAGTTLPPHPLPLGDRVSYDPSNPAILFTQVNLIKCASVGSPSSSGTPVGALSRDTSSVALIELQVSMWLTCTQLTIINK